MTAVKLCQTIQTLSIPAADLLNRVCSCSLFIFFLDYRNIPLFEVLYRHHFRNILYCGEAHLFPRNCYQIISDCSSFSKNQVSPTSLWTSTWSSTRASREPTSPSCPRTPEQGISPNFYLKNKFYENYLNTGTSAYLAPSRWATTSPATSS